MGDAYVFVTLGNNRPAIASPDLSGRGNPIGQIPNDKAQMSKRPVRIVSSEDRSVTQVLSQDTNLHILSGIGYT
jgi:hypothetical protein